MAHTPQGQRNGQLNLSAYRMGQLVGARLLDLETVKQSLAAAARVTGLPEHEIRTVLRDSPTAALQQGMQEPRQPDQLATTYTISEVGHIGPAADQTDTDEQPEHSSWWPLPLPTAVTGTDNTPTPTHLIRDDGQPLFYSGQVNGLIGESESGKSWIALLAIVQALNAGQPVLMLDFEDSPASIHQRMHYLGLTDDQLQAFHYANPDDALDAVARADLNLALDNHYRVIVVDGVNAAMSLLGMELNSNNDATMFAAKVLRPLAKTGACVITVDHVPKNIEARGKGGIGAQAKRAMTDGCALTVDIIEPFGKGTEGQLTLTVDKDRHGQIRGKSADQKHAGIAHLESAGEHVRIHIAAPEQTRTDWEPYDVMEAITTALADVDRPLSFRQIKQLVRGRDDTIRAAVVALTKRGHVKVQPGPRRALLHQLISRFDPGSDTET